MAQPYNGILFGNKKRTKYWYMVQHGWFFKALRMKAKWKKSVTKNHKVYEWVHLLKMSRIGRSIEKKYISGCLGLSGREGKKGNNC